MFASKSKFRTYVISLWLIMVSAVIGSSAHAEVYKCKVNGAIEYRAKKCAKGSERDINVPLNIPKVPDYKALEAQRLADAKAKEEIDKYKNKLTRHQNDVRRQQNKLNELLRNRDEEISLLKRRAKRLGDGEYSASQRKTLGKQLRASRKRYDEQIAQVKLSLRVATTALKDFLSQPKPAGYEQIYMDSDNSAPVTATSAD